MSDEQKIEAAEKLKEYADQWVKVCIKFQF
jgi:hypothetical protein